MKRLGVEFQSFRGSQDDDEISEELKTFGTDHNGKAIRVGGSAN